LIPLLLAGSCALGDGLGPGPEVAAEVERFVQLMNDHRQSVGCQGLDWNTRVAVVAQAHSEDMVARSFFDHTNPDGDSPFDRLRDASIAFTAAAENIAFGQPTADVVLDSWLTSSGHRANIENCDLTEHGVGLDSRYWTHVFIRP
jgi:uncharacterized protein YkwD